MAAEDAVVPEAARWLYKRGDILLGPVTLEQLVEKLYDGEIDPATPVAEHGERLDFRPLGELTLFRVHVAKSQVKQRVEAQSAEQQRRRRAIRAARMAGIGLVAVALVVAFGRLAWWLAIHQPWQRKIHYLEPVITEELPTIHLASARPLDAELDYPDAKRAPRPDKAPARRNNGKPAKPPPPGGKQVAAATPGAPVGGEVEADGLEAVQNFDRDAINGVVRSNKASLHKCLADEAKRQKGAWEARVPIEFTVGNDGRVTKLWIDNPDYKSEGTDLYRCMFGELKRWRFPAYEGEQANVSLAFHIRAQ